MGLRIITVPLFDADSDDAALGAAFDIACRFEAHVLGLFARPDPADVMPMMGEGISRSVVDDLMREAEAEIERRRTGAQARFEAARVAAHVPLADSPPGPGPTSTRWREVEGRRERVFPEEARLADLVIFGRGGDGPLDANHRLAIETTLFGSARPLLLVPPGAPEHIGHNVAIAWNGGIEAIRALTGAMPFLERAVGVHVLTAETWRTRPEASIGLAEYLEWQSVRCERRPVAVKDEPAGAALLRTAGEVGADLLVMGGYGRPRLSELILGGVTRHVLNHQGHLPVLMAH